MTSVTHCDHPAPLGEHMPRTLVGLDIGSTGVRAAEFVPGRRRSTVRRYASVPLAPGVVRAGTVVDGDALAQALRQLWSQGRFSTREVALGIASSGVLVRQLDLDWMPADDFRKALRYQVQDVLPFSVDEANLDYHLLEELDVTGEDGEPRRVARILLVAAAREVVDAFVAAARGARLRPQSVDLLPFALLRARTPAVAGDTGVTEALVDVGADVVSVVVHSAGTPRYVRMISGLGGDTVTEAVQQRYDWSWDDAERTKVYVGLPGHAHLDPSQRVAVTPRSDGLDHAAQQVVAVAADQLASEIAATLDFYRASSVDSDDLPVGRVLLAGGGALLGGFAERLAQRLDLPVERLDITGRLRAPRRVHLADLDPADLAVPVGLCAGAAR
jgi:type IV pilus assembly protein PilM